MVFGALHSEVKQLTSSARLHSHRGSERNLYLTLYRYKFSHFLLHWHPSKSPAFRDRKDERTVIKDISLSLIVRETVHLHRKSVDWGAVVECDVVFAIDGIAAIEGNAGIAPFIFALMQKRSKKIKNKESLTRIAGGYAHPNMEVRFTPF